MNEAMPKYHPEHPRPCYECKTREERFHVLEAKLADALLANNLLTDSLHKAMAEVERLKANARLDGERILFLVAHDISHGCNPEERWRREGGGRETDTSGEAFPTRVASPPRSLYSDPYVCSLCAAHGESLTWLRQHQRSRHRQPRHPTTRKKDTFVQNHRGTETHPEMEE